MTRVQFPTWTVNNGQDDLFGDWSTNARFFNGVDEVVLKEKLKSGWIQESGNTYYYQNNVSLIGFQKINGQIYYFKTSGAPVNKERMPTGSKVIDGEK